MADIHRYYKCGCCPDEDHFCKEAEKHVWREREAAMTRALDHISREGAERAAWNEGYGRGWMNCHIGTQERAGAYEDVDLGAIPEPDDGYDEDPREVGYPA